MAKNTMLKTRKADNPYEVWVYGDWTWKVLKKYQADDHKPFAKWLVAAQSPGTFGGWDMGDNYAAEIMAIATLVETNYDA